MYLGADYMANFSPRAMFKIGWEKVAGKRLTQAVRIPKVIFQPGLKFECDYTRFFSPFHQAEISSPGWNSVHVIANVFLRGFVQAAELKSQP